MWVGEYDQFIEESLYWLDDIKCVVNSLSFDEWQFTRLSERLQEIEQGIQELSSTKNEQLIWEVQSWITQFQEDVQLYFQELKLKRFEESVGKHELPQLPYAYDALEPYISKRIMFLHHTKHHQSYVDGLNLAEKKLSEARQNNQFELIKYWENELNFNGSGDYLHTIFWKIMSPNGGGQPKGELLQQINKDFTSYDQFKEQFTACANKVEGSGWALVVYAIQPKKLEIIMCEKHQNGTQWDSIPLLVCDVWEHAYYLQYENKRADYVKQWWNVVNWKEVEKRFQAAKKHI